MQKFPAAFGLTIVVAFKCAWGQDLHAAEACTRLTDDAARLSCYDAAMGVEKSSSGALKSQARPQPRAVGNDARSNFGDDGRFHTEIKTNVSKNLTAQLREVVLLPQGLYRLTLDNGQVWETTQADPALTFKTSDAVTISRGWLGSYQISLAGHTTSIGATRKL